MAFKPTRFGEQPATRSHPAGQAAIGQTPQAPAVVFSQPTPNPNLTAALRASLAEVEAATDSPLGEATPDSVDELLTRINSAFADGLPHLVTDDELRKAVDIFRAKALEWEQQEQIKKANPGRRSAKPKGVVLELDLDNLL